MFVESVPSLYVLGSTGCVSLTTKGSGGTAHTCIDGRHSQYSCALLAASPVPGVALHGILC